MSDNYKKVYDFQNKRATMGASGPRRTEFPPAINGEPYDPFLDGLFGGREYSLSRGGSIGIDAQGRVWGGKGVSDVDKQLLRLKYDYEKSNGNKETIAERARQLRAQNPGRWTVSAEKPLFDYEILQNPLKTGIWALRDHSPASFVSSSPVASSKAEPVKKAGFDGSWTPGFYQPPADFKKPLKKEPEKVPAVPATPQKTSALPTGAALPLRDVSCALSYAPSHLSGESPAPGGNQGENNAAPARQTLAETVEPDGVENPSELSLTSSEKSPQTSRPSDVQSKYYRDEKTNPFANKYAGECTWYAYGRAKETSELSMPTGNAYTWLDSAKQMGLNTSDRIQPNSVAVFSGGRSGKGHVVYIEDVRKNSDGTVSSIRISEYNWVKYHQFSTDELSMDEFDRRYKNLSFEGCIVLS